MTKLKRTYFLNNPLFRESLSRKIVTKCSHVKVYPAEFL